MKDTWHENLMACTPIQWISKYVHTYSNIYTFYGDAENAEKC